MVYYSSNDAVWDNFYSQKFFLKRNSYEYLWSFLFRLLMDPEAHEIITFIGVGLRFKIRDFRTLALLYYYPNDRHIFSDMQIINIFRSALSKSQAICNCWYKNNDVFDFTKLRERELEMYSGMNIGELLQYAYCVRPIPEKRVNYVVVNDTNQCE